MSKREHERYLDQTRYTVDNTEYGNDPLNIHELLSIQTHFTGRQSKRNPGKAGYRVYPTTIPPYRRVSLLDRTGVP
jgi:hypothetical protein